VARSIVTMQDQLNSSISGPPKWEWVGFTHCQEGLWLFSNTVLFYVKQIEIGRDTADSIVWPSPYASIDTCVWHVPS
jgi:hypothetical protein